MPTVLGFPVCGRLDSVQRRGPAPKRSCDETDCSSGSIRVLHLGVFRRPGYGTDISLRPYPSERTRSGVAANRYEKYFGGRRIAEGPDRIMFGSTRLLFLKKADAKPSSGSAVDHIGFSFADLDAKMKEFEAAGIKLVTPVRDVPGCSSSDSWKTHGARASKWYRIRNCSGCTTFRCVDRTRTGFQLAAREVRRPAHAA